ncbi:AroM family protein [Escherichia albertii]|uniref:AroM family protein n=1 Tax=Escherichia albertii TaxID=208962 RepID=UPI0006A09E38|nr:AroM family protein [Escherichia albertii]CTW21885.1 putative chorismate biosynthesis protein [Escherichia coli]EFF0798695.1 AroM family protein [Escherichia albertii]EHG7530723.1 AroM family protein [Escherichia albertii]MCV3254896.1 AroM family protein [Escherichia albertii]MCV3268897.1 AroM family protein [Escherichia albertii]
MSASLAILTIGIVPLQEVLPLLTEYIDEKNISHHSLLGNLSREKVMAEYAPQAGEETILTLLNDNQLAQVSRRKIERDLQSVVEVLDNQGYDVILLMSTAAIRGMTVRNTIFLEPLRILPPLVSSIVEGHQVGVIVPVEELLEAQAQKWQILQKTPLFSLGDPVHDSEQKIIEAGKELLANGADVIMLDCLGFNQRHRDLLQKQLDVPVLLSNVLIARLAAELLM